MGLDGIKIVSGGQTGVDRAALDWAITHGVEHDGWCPQGRKAEDGTIDARYGLKETPSANYVQRTEWNVRDSEATVILSLKPVLSGGSQKTLDLARKQRKPCLVLSRTAWGEGAGARLHRFIQEHGVRVLHVAGPRESEEPEVGDFTWSVLEGWRQLSLDSGPSQPLRSTPRLTLRALTPEDVPAVARMAGRREIADTTISIPHPYSEEQARDWIGRLAESAGSGKELVFGVVRGSALVGVAGLRDVSREHAQAELGYWIAVEHWGQGYATEAAEALVRFGFEELGLNRIFAHHMARNPASGRVLEKIGMKPEGVLRQRVKKWGVFEDVLILALLREDWLNAHRAPRTDTAERRDERVPAP